MRAGPHLVGQGTRGRDYQTTLRPPSRRALGPGETMMGNAKTIALTVLLAAASGNAGSLVVGTGDPNLDVPAVQAAVDRGGQVILKGHFSFDRPPEKPAGAVYERTVTVSKEVVISGERDEHGNMPAI